MSVSQFKTDFFKMYFSLFPKLYRSILIWGCFFSILVLNNSISLEDKIGVFPHVHFHNIAFSKSVAQFVINVTERLHTDRFLKQ